MGLTYQSNKICPRCGTGGYVWYLDNSEYVAKCTNCGHYFRREDFPMCVLEEAPKPITNADRIRAMSDKELAELFMQEYDCSDSFTCPVQHPCPPEKEASCRECFLDWLKEEADHD